MRRHMIKRAMRAIATCFLVAAGCGMGAARVSASSDPTNPSLVLPSGGGCAVERLRAILRNPATGAPITTKLGPVTVDETVKLCPAASGSIHPDLTYRGQWNLGCAGTHSVYAAWDIWNSNQGQSIVYVTEQNGTVAMINGVVATAPANNVATYYVSYPPSSGISTWNFAQFYTSNSNWAFDYAYCS